MTPLTTALRRAAAVLVALILVWPARAADPTRPNILLVLADDMGYGDVGCNGAGWDDAGARIPTPNIDRLARAGLRFTDAHAPGAWCTPSRYGLLTGRYPYRVLLPGAGRPVIHPERVTLASFLKSAGYATAMVGKWHLGFDGEPLSEDDPSLRGGPLDRGFDTYFGIPSSLDIPPYYYVRDRAPVAPPTDTVAASASEGWTNIQGAFWRAGGIAPGFRHDEVLTRFVDEAVGFVESREGAQEPFFLYLALAGPHTPWLPADEYEGSSGAGMYGDFVAQVDAELGRLLSALDEGGLAQDTLVVFTSDNGPVWYPRDVERFGHRAAGPWRGMKSDAWEGGHRMPFVARWPARLPAGATIDATTCFVDLMATLAGLLERELPPGAGEDGVDLSELWLGEEQLAPERKLILKQNATVLREGRWKWIDHLGSGGFSKPRRVEPAPDGPAGQLYDLEADPGETRNLALEQPELAARLAAALASFRASVEREER